MLQRRSSKDTGAIRPAPSFFSSEQVGQQPSATYASLRSSLRNLSASTSRNMAPKMDSSHNSFTANYLTDLRTNRPPRPGGARPLPTRDVAKALVLDQDSPIQTESALSRPSDNGAVPDRSASAMSHSRAQSTLPSEKVGRPLAKQPYPNVKSRDFSGATKMTNETSKSTSTNKTSSSTDSAQRYSIPYYERGQRWMEKQETNSLRTALEDMDLKEEARIHAAAQDEAAELVWKHRNQQDPGVPYRNPDADYKQHLQKGSHARSQSVGPFSSLYIRKRDSTEGSRSASDGSNTSGGDRIVSSGSHKSDKSSPYMDGAADERVGRRPDIEPEPGSLKQRISRSPFSIPARMSFRRRSSSAKARIASGESGKSLFLNPNDQIYEEPEDSSPVEQIDANTGPLSNKPRNTSYTFRGVRDRFEKAATVPVVKVSNTDNLKNPPTRSRDASYRRNNVLSDTEADRPDSGTPPAKNGIEIRGDDIRAATSMRRSDRSPKLPMPAVVSDRPGRPIVSFDPSYKPREVELRQESCSRPSSRNIAAEYPTKPPMVNFNSEPVIPMISISDAPSVQINDSQSMPTIDIPSISVSSDTPSTSMSPLVQTVNVLGSGSTRPLPRPGTGSHPQAANRPFPHHSSTAPVKSSKHWSPAHHPHRAQAQCAACALPISGRIVGAASQRYHPACFSCFNCGELLECVAFYPEPEKFRSERLARIEARVNDQHIPDDEANHTEEDDGDSSLRFYCHLDFHEKFSPRCRSCKTPIEGEVVLACGGEWHVGHFFCAECGDPFEPTTPFVEKDGFAWCVGCHTNRFSGKCAGCKKPIVDTVVKAMGKEWHDKCFCCKECGGAFDDGRFFTRDQDEAPVCVGCEERRLKA